MSPRSRKSPQKQAQRAPEGPGPDPAQPLTVIAGAALAVTPLALVPGIFISHDVIPKVIILTVAAAMVLSLYPRWAPFLRTMWNRSNGRLFLILILAQIASLAISTLCSSQVPLSLAGTVWRRFGLIGQSATLVVAVAVASLAASRPAWIGTLFRAVSVCGGLAAIYGVLQYFNIDPFLDRRLYAIDYFGGITRPPSTMGHALYFSAYLVPVLFIALASMIAETGGAWRRVHASVAVLASAAIVLSATRSAMLAAVAGGLFFGWRAIRRGAEKHTRTALIKYVAVGFATVLVVSGFVLSPAGSNLRNRILQWRADLGGPRLQMWKECPGLIALHPLLGEGPEVFAGEFRRVESVQLSRAYPDFYNETPHNALIDAACGQGIPGALILAGAFALVWRVGRRADFVASPVRAGLNSAMVGILISSMFASLTLVTSMYLWTIAGLAVALNPGTAMEDSRRVWRVPRLAPMIMGIAYLVPGAMLSLQDSAWSELGSAVGRGNFGQVRDAYSRAISVAFGMPGYELWGSREWALLGRSLSGSGGDSAEAAGAWKMAADAAELAEAGGEERFSAAYQASVLGVAAGDATRAEAKARAAIRLAPNWYKAHLLLSQILGFTGRNDESGREAALSVRLGWRK